MLIHLFVTVFGISGCRPLYRIRQYRDSSTVRSWAHHVRSGGASIGGCTSRYYSRSPGGFINRVTNNADTDKEYIARLGPCSILLQNPNASENKASIDQNDNPRHRNGLYNLAAQASQPTPEYLRQLAGLRLDAIPCRRDRGNASSGYQRHHPSPREVTSSPAAWRREVVAHWGRTPATDQLGSTNGFCADRGFGRRTPWRSGGLPLADRAPLLSF